MWSLLWNYEPSFFDNSVKKFRILIISFLILIFFCITYLTGCTSNFIKIKKFYVGDLRPKKDIGIVIKFYGGFYVNRINGELFGKWAELEPGTYVCDIGYFDSYDKSTTLTSTKVLKTSFNVKAGYVYYPNGTIDIKNLGWTAKMIEIQPDNIHSDELLKELSRYEYSRGKGYYMN